MRFFQCFIFSTAIFFFHRNASNSLHFIIKPTDEYICQYEYGGVRLCEKPAYVLIMECTKLDAFWWTLFWHETNVLCKWIDNLPTDEKFADSPYRNIMTTGSRSSNLCMIPTIYVNSKLINSIGIADTTAVPRYGTLAHPSSFESDPICLLRGEIHTVPQHLHASSYIGSTDSPELSSLS